MEDVVKVLIWIVIIISFFSSFFKKKKLPQNPDSSKSTSDRIPQTGYSSSREDPVQTANKDMEEYDILKEIETMFGNPRSRQDAPNTYSPSNVRKAEEEIESENTLTYSEHNFENWDKKIDVKNTVTQVDDSVSKQAAAFEKYLRKKDSVYINYASLINKRFKQPSSLKEYVIISEILTRPRALRRLKRINL